LIVFAVVASAAVHAAPPADVALAVVYDTSGSMKTPIRAQDGRLVAKHIIAKRAFDLVIDRLERFTQPGAGHTAKNLNLGIVIFEGVRTRDALPMAPFNAGTTRQWLTALPVPDSGTPLGNAMLAAGRALQATPAASKHLLVLTDGENTSGATPLAALNALQKQTRGQDQAVFVHIIALDIPPEVFASLQKAGATLIGASDEKQLQSQLDFILENQILVEAP
jgi:von Willebrand factor type A domain